MMNGQRRCQSSPKPITDMSSINARYKTERLLGEEKRGLGREGGRNGGPFECQCLMMTAGLVPAPGLNRNTRRRRHFLLACNLRQKYMAASFAGLLFSDRNLLSSFALTFSFSPISGRVPPVHRGPAAAREVVRVHVVQPAGGQEEVLQEAREEDVPRGGAQVQGGAHGEWSVCSIVSHKRNKNQGGIMHGLHVFVNPFCLKKGGKEQLTA